MSRITGGRRRRRMIRGERDKERKKALFTSGPRPKPEIAMKT